MKKQGRLTLIQQFSKGTVSYFVIVLAASLAATMLNATIPRIFSFTIDRVLVVDGIPWLKAHLWILSLVVILVAVFNGFSIFLYRNYTAKAGETFAKNMRDALFVHVQRLPMWWHTSHQTGDIIQRCTADVDTIRNFVITQVLEVFRTVFLLVVSLSMMFSMNVKLTLVALAFMPVIVIYSGIFYTLIARNFTKADEAEGELSTVVQENATGVRVVRAFGREMFEIERFDEKNDLFAKMWIRLGTLSGLYWAIGDIITGFQVIFVIVFGAIEAVHGNITAGQFVAFASYNTTLVWPVRSLGRILSEMSKTGVSFERVNYILNAKEEDLSDEGLVPDDISIEFKHVSFGYQKSSVISENSPSDVQKNPATSENSPSDVQKNPATSENSTFDFQKDALISENSPVESQGDSLILKDVSFRIDQRETYGILGGTGSGKSTLVHLLDRLYECNTGEISIGGIPLSDISPRWLRTHVGIVLQEPFLFSRTIRENIAATNPDASMEEIRAAARIACVDETIMGFADGYDTIVGERGVTLSGGQRQRVAIARLLVSKSPIMIFDDSLSAVDAETDVLIRRALKEKMKDATVIIISHRITTLMEADRILVLHHGRLVESGTHSELIQNDGIYQKIYDIQMNQDDRKLLEESDNSAPVNKTPDYTVRADNSLLMKGGSVHES